MKKKVNNLFFVLLLINIFSFNNINASPIGALVKPIGKFFSELFTDSAPKVIKQSDSLLNKNIGIIERELIPLSRPFNNSHAELINLFPEDIDINYLLKAQRIVSANEYKVYAEYWNQLKINYPEYFQELEKQLKNSIFSKFLNGDDLITKLAKSEYILWTSLFTVSSISMDLDASQGGEVRYSSNDNFSLQTPESLSVYSSAVKRLNCLHAYQVIKLRLPDLDYSSFSSRVSDSCPKEEPDEKLLVNMLFDLKKYQIN